MAKALAVVEPQNTAMQQLKTGPARLGDFLKDVRTETKKVVSPSRTEVQSTTLIVIITVFIFAFYFALIDFLVGRGMDLLFKHLAK